MPVTVSCHALARQAESAKVQRQAHLISNHGEELPVFVSRGRGCHGCSAGQLQLVSLRVVLQDGNDDGAQAALSLFGLLARRTESQQQTMATLSHLSQ